MQMGVHLTAPLSEDFSDKKLIDGFGLKCGEGRSIVIENKDHYTAETKGRTKDQEAVPLRARPAHHC